MARVKAGALVTVLGGALALATCACFEPKLRCPVICNERLGCPSGQECQNGLCRGDDDGCAESAPRLCGKDGCVPGRESIEPLIRLWLEPQTLPADGAPILIWRDRTVHANHAIASFPGREPKAVTDLNLRGLRTARFAGHETALRISLNPTLRLGTSEFTLLIATSARAAPTDGRLTLLTQGRFVLWFYARDALLGIAARASNGAPCTRRPDQGTSSDPSAADCPAVVSLMAPEHDSANGEDPHGFNQEPRVLVLRRGAGFIELRGMDAPPPQRSTMPAAFEIGDDDPLRIGGDGVVEGFWGSIAALMLIVGPLSADQAQAIEQFFVREYK